MAVSEKLEYNLPGFGLVQIQLFPNVKKVFDFLDSYNHIQYLKEISQLGALKQMLPGAHHTRYEYLMSQLALITELCKLKGHQSSGFSLSRNQKTFGIIPGLPDPSNGEILMILALVSNMGQFPVAFAGQKALIKYLKDNLNTRQAFLEGLPEKFRQQCTLDIKSSNVFRFSYYTGVFLLNRYRRKSGSKDIVDMCFSILASFMKIDKSSQAILALWDFYRRIRRVTYLALDSHYAPVPFSINLSSIFFSLNYYLNDVFAEDSTFQNALQQLEWVLRDTVYMSPKNQINNSLVSDSILDKLLKNEFTPQNITSWWKILKPCQGNSSIFSDSNKNFSKLINQSKLFQINFQLDKHLSNQIIEDPIEWQNNSKLQVGLSSSLFAADLDPTNKVLKITSGIPNEYSDEKAKRVAFKVVKRVLDFEQKILKTDIRLSTQSITQNGLQYFKFLLPIIFGSDYNFRLSTKPAIGPSPVIRANGAQNTSLEVLKYYNWAEKSGFFNDDSLWEIKCLEKTLNKIQYRGTTLAFVGTTEIIKGTKIIAEWDSLLFLLSRNLPDPSVLIIEAKNYSHGFSDAKKQLTTRLTQLNIDNSNYTIQSIDNRGAYASLKI